MKKKPICFVLPPVYDIHMLKTLKFVIEFSFMRIIFITDSYGGPRIHGNMEDISAARTYPELAKIELAKEGHEVLIDHASFRKITDLPELLKKYPNGDLYVLQAGIVDLYPRPLSQKLTLSQSVAAKSLRRLVRLNRAFCIKYINNTPWSSEQEIRNALSEILSSGIKCIWINAAPVNEYQNKQTPGANASIVRFNALLGEELKKYPNCHLLNIHERLMSEKDPELYMHPVDSHMNKEGNRFYAEAILSGIKKIFSLAV